MAFVPRLTAPSASDPYWIQIQSGGYNECIYGSDGPPSVLPNCTGYVHGRVMEIRGVTTDNCGLSFGNAVTYWTDSSSNWLKSQDPSIGAILCYYTNVTDNYSPGHVAVVEQIIDANTCIVSESNWNGTRWQLLTCRRAYGWRPEAGWNVSPQGFLINPYIEDEPEPPEPPEPPVVGPMTDAVRMILLNRRRKKKYVGKRTILL